MHKKWFLYLLFLFTCMTYAVAQAATIEGEPDETDIDVPATVEMQVASPQIKALVPSYLSVQIDPNQEPNYSTVSEGGFICSYGQFRNDGTVPLAAIVIEPALCEQTYRQASAAAANCSSEILFEMPITPFCSAPSPATASVC